MKHQHFAKSERGQSFTELAISATFLLILLAGVVDLGRALFTYIALRDAVQEGASYAAIEPNDCKGTIDRIREHTTQPINLSDPTIIVSVNVDGFPCPDVPGAQPPANTICPGDTIEIGITYNDFDITTPFIGTIVGSQKLTLQTKVFDSVVVDPDPISSKCALLTSP